MEVLGQGFHGTCTSLCNVTDVRGRPYYVITQGLATWKHGGEEHVE